MTNERTNPDHSHPIVFNYLSIPRYGRRKAVARTDVPRILRGKSGVDNGYPEIDYPSSDYQRKYET